MSAETQLVRQGWSQTVVIILTFVITGILAFAKLEAMAQKALETGVRAETKADAVADQSQKQMNELTRIRTVLEERLPPRSSVSPLDK